MSKIPQYAKSVFDMAFELSEARDTIAAQAATIAQLREALEDMTNAYVHETAQRWSYTNEQVEKMSPRVVSARQLLAALKGGE